MADAVDCDHTRQENIDDNEEANEADNHHQKRNDGAISSSKSVITVRLHPASTEYRVFMAQPDIFLGAHHIPIVGPVVEVEEQALLSGSDQVYSKFRELLSLTNMSSPFREMVVRSAVSKAGALILHSRKIEPAKEWSELLWTLRFPTLNWVELWTDEVHMVPASNSAIEALEGGTLRDVVQENTCDEFSCTVCMEELDAESLVTRMPCKHVFHSQCITQWLNVSHYCPLCRYEIS